MSKIESLDENQKARLKEYILQGRPYDEILKEYPQMNKTNLSNYKKKMLLTGSNTTDISKTTEKFEPNPQFLIDRLISNIVICSEEIEKMRQMKNPTSSSRQAIASLIGKMNESLRQLESFLSKLQADLEIDTKLLMEFLIWRKQREVNQ